jgi:formylglycine-generating enzyme required for sulfatase activity
MKTSVILFACLLIPGIACAQNSQGKGMVFCPQGSFTSVKVENGDTTRLNISLDAFWISNEITNQEYRRFYESIKATPGDTIFLAELLSTGSENNTAGSNKPAYRVRPFLHSDILSGLIDLTVAGIGPRNLKNEEYFFKSEYNNYPVAGVSFRGAQFYCIWKTEQERKSNSGNLYDFRLPQETEWEYAAVQPMKHSSGKSVNDLHPVKQGLMNEWGIPNMGDNISEWTASGTEQDGKQMQIVRGGNWTNEWSVFTREVTDPGKANSHTGFRIVQTYSRK